MATGWFHRLLVGLLASLVGWLITAVGYFMASLFVGRLAG
jgi:hypothetical protein